MNHLDRRTFLLGSAGAVTTAGLLAACGTDSGGSGPTGSASAGTSAALPTYIPFEGATPDIAGEPGRSTPVYFRYPDNPERLHAEAPGDGEPFTALVIADTAPPALDQNPYWQELNARLGSPYEPVFSPAADYANKFATVTAGDDLPDFFLVLPTTPAIPQLLGARAADLTEYLSGDAIADYPGLANLDTASWAGTVFDGAIRAIPITRGFTTSWIMYRRLDLLEPLGLDADPTSFEEWRDILVEANDPSNSRWTLGSLPTDFIRQSLGIPNQWSVDGSGTFTSAFEHEAQQEALEAARAIWEDGLVNPDAPATHDSQQREWLLSGTCLMVWNTLSGWGTAAGGGGQVEGYRGTGTVPPAFAGGTATPYLGNPNHSIVAINAAAADRVPTLLKIADWLATPFGTEEWLARQYGIPGTHYEMVDGVPQVNPDTAPQRGLGQGYVAAPTGVLFSSDADLITRQHDFEAAWTENAIGDPSLGLYSETASRQGAALLTALKAAETDIVTGRAPVSSWPDAVATFLSGGGEAIKTELSEAYAAANG